YSANMGVGHQKPAPSFGSPTFAMHLGIWQKLQSDESNPAFRKGAIEKKYGHFDQHNFEFYEEINDFIVDLQRKGRVLRKFPVEAGGDPAESNIDKFLFVAPQQSVGSIYRQEVSGKSSHKFKNYNPQSVSFTLWWQDADANGKPVKNVRQEHSDFS